MSVTTRQTSCAPAEQTPSARIAGFYHMSLAERVAALRQHGWLSELDYQALLSSSHCLDAEKADRMIENVITRFGLPEGLALNFLINGRDVVVPLVVEEPSIVAALSFAAKLARAGGGFQAKADKPLLMGQIQVVDIDNIQQAQNRLYQQQQAILDLANCTQPNMVARGGGAQSIEVILHTNTAVGDMLVMHLFVDTCDAMGANLVNSMCEAVAPQVQQLTGGRVVLRILSNLCDRALVRARVQLPLAALGVGGADPEAVRDGIIIATELANVDPYRAATHNKGVMNGIDALAIATGNDWRAIEAAAHAYAARGHHYSALTQWRSHTNGDLLGEIKLPLKVGTVGGPLETNPTVALNHRLLGQPSARQLAEIMATVGLAQNFSALRALVTEGIQQGHMALHARSVVQAAGASPEVFQKAVERIVASGEIKIWKAREIIQSLHSKNMAHNTSPTTQEPSSRAKSHGKIILFGEHAAVYGRHALAAPIPLAIEAHVCAESEGGVSLYIPNWGIAQKIRFSKERTHFYDKTLGYILEQLDLLGQAIRITVEPKLPRAMGLGSSAASAVAIIRALDDFFRLHLSDTRINALAFACEKIAHQTPSGIDNTVATFGRPILFCNSTQPTTRVIKLKEALPIVIAMTGVENLTAKMVARVRGLWSRNQALCERIFDEINALSLQGTEAIEACAYEQLGDLMNVCHGLLNALNVSCAEVERLVQLARKYGALGAKLTGSGGGGAIIALSPDQPERLVAAIQAEGFDAMAFELPAT